MEQLLAETVSSMREEIYIPKSCIHSFTMHLFRSTLSQALNEETRMGGAGPALQEVAGERRRKVVNRCSAVNTAVRLAVLEVWAECRAFREHCCDIREHNHHSLGSRKSWSATGRQVLWHFKC